MIKIIINFFILFITFSCSDKHNSSFDNLSNSFFKWHNKYSDNLFNTFSYDSLLNQKQFIGASAYRDMKRFSIELNQINNKKISESRQNDYYLLSKYLDYNIFNYEKIKESEWNLIGLLEDIKSNIVNLLILDEHNAISDSFFNNNINFISLKINSILNSVRYCHSNKSYIEMTNYLLDDITRIINLSNNKILKSDLVTLKSWYADIYNKLNPFEHPSLKFNYAKYLSIQFDENIDLDATIELAKKLIKNYENNIFESSLPIYLSNNDEPVWMDYQDTLAVINWMMINIDNLSKSNSNCLNKDNILLTPKNFLAIQLKSKDLDLIENIEFKNSSITEKPLYLYDYIHDSFIALNYMKEDNPVKLYFNILNDLIPGDLFIDYSIKKSPSFINQVYNDLSYSYSYKKLMLDNYLDTFLKINNSIDSNCQKEYENYSYMLDLQFDIAKIKNCISTIASINYHHYGIAIEETINKYKYLNFFSDQELSEIKLEIFGFRVDSVIKFKSYYLAYKMYQQSVLNNNSEYFINILKDHPNASFTTIKQIIQ